MEFLSVLAGLLAISSLSCFKVMANINHPKNEDLQKNMEIDSLEKRRLSSMYPLQEDRNRRSNNGWTNFPISSWRNVYQVGEQSHPRPNFPGVVQDGWGGWKSDADNKGRQIATLLRDKKKLFLQALQLSGIYTSKALSALIFLGKLKLVPTPQHHIQHMQYGSAIAHRPDTKPPASSGWRGPPPQSGWDTPPSTPPQSGWDTPPSTPPQSGWDTPPSTPPQSGWDTPPSTPPQSGWGSPVEMVTTHQQPPPSGWNTVATTGTGTHQSSGPTETWSNWEGPTDVLTNQVQPSFGWKGRGETVTSPPQASAGWKNSGEIVGSGPPHPSSEEWRSTGENVISPPQSSSGRWRSSGENVISPPQTSSGWKSSGETGISPPQTSSGGWRSSGETGISPPQTSSGWKSSGETGISHPRPQPPSEWTSQGHQGNAPSSSYGVPSNGGGSHGVGRGWGVSPGPSVGGSGWSGNTGKGALWRSIGYGLGSGLAGLGNLGKNVASGGGGWRGGGGLGSGLVNLIGTGGSIASGLGGLAGLVGRGGSHSALGSGLAGLMGGNGWQLGSGLASLMGGGGGGSSGEYSGPGNDWISSDSSSMKARAPSSNQDFNINDYLRFAETPTRNLYQARNKGNADAPPTAGKLNGPNNGKGFGYNYGDGNEYSSGGGPSYAAPSSGHTYPNGINVNATNNTPTNFGENGDLLAVMLKAPPPDSKPTRTLPS